MSPLRASAEHDERGPSAKEAPSQDLLAGDLFKPTVAEHRRRVVLAEQLAEHIECTVSQAPPLTDDQRSRLALLLRGDAA